MSWGTILSAVLSIVGWILKRNADKRASLDAFEKLVSAAADEGLISVKSKQKFEDQKTKLQERLKNGEVP